MGRAVFYCAVCGGPLEDINTSPDVHGEYDENVLPKVQTKFSVGYPQSIMRCDDMTDKIWGNDWYMRFSENLSFLSGDDDSGLSHFSVSAPASDAEFMCVSIENTFPSPSSKWAVMKGRKWQVFEQDEAGVVLYPIHDCCLHIMAQTSRRNSRQANKSSTAFANVQSYYQAMLRLHLRNTIGEGWDFAPFGLEWEHQYYGAQEFADGFSWSSCPGWEWLCSPPDKIPGLTTYILSRLKRIDVKNESLTDHVEITETSSHTISRISSIERLPTEIVSQIVSNLQTTPALRLHQCSKTLAGHIPLNQAFWREQLITGDLVEYLWDLDMKECRLKDLSYPDKTGALWDWKSLAKTLVSAHILAGTLAGLFEGGLDELSSRHTSLSLTASDVTMPDAPIGLKNRCRIVKIIRDIERLDAIEAKDPTVVEYGQLAVPHRLSLNPSTG